MYCSKCGKLIGDDQRFCSYCGNDMSTIKKLADEANDLLKKADKAVEVEVDNIARDISGKNNQNNTTQNMNQNVNNNNDNVNSNNNNTNNESVNNNTTNQQNSGFNNNNYNSNNGFGRQAIKDNRSLGVYILLSIVTCGIYGLYFIYKLAKDLNEACDDGDNTAGLATYFILSILTCGIYSLVWMYKVGNRIQRNAVKYEIFMNENGTTVLVWCLVGALACGIGPFIAMHIVIKNSNILFRAYNKKNGLTFIN